MDFNTYSTSVDFSKALKLLFTNLQYFLSKFTTSRSQVLDTFTEAVITRDYLNATSSKQQRAIHSEVNNSETVYL